MAVHQAAAGKERDQRMQTKLYQLTPEDTGALRELGALLRGGGLAGIPTETVYGLAANAFDGPAVAKIFRAKGRPQDNPLIVHICAFSQIYALVREVPMQAVALARAYWPGPLTMILPKSPAIPEEVSAGLGTVAVRMPSHPLARAIIRAAGVPLAAPSANLSGSPSPTTARHVLDDMDGRIEAVVDGGPCAVGVESTVVTLAAGRPRLLRPGGITLGQLRAVLGAVEVDHAVEAQLAAGEQAASPGMKYKHYAPKAHVVIVRGPFDRYAEFVNAHAGEGVAALCYEGEEAALQARAIPCGRRGDPASQARHLFDTLRALDAMGVQTAYARCPEKDGVGLAVYNRLLRAAAFEIIDVSQ